MRTKLRGAQGFSFSACLTGLLSLYGPDSDSPLFFHFHKSQLTRGWPPPRRAASRLTLHEEIIEHALLFCVKHGEIRTWGNKERAAAAFYPPLRHAMCIRPTLQLKREGTNEAITEGREGTFYYHVAFCDLERRRASYSRIPSASSLLSSTNLHSYKVWFEMDPK